jgi:hypothetical protein
MFACIGPSSGNETFPVIVSGSTAGDARFMEPVAAY